MKKLYLSIVLLFFYYNSVLSQSVLDTETFSNTPQVFLISENDEAYGALVSNTPTLLIEICDDSMEKAYKKWVYMLADIEEYAEKKEYDIKGIKIWINVFWNKDGTIKHIVYHPKPNSKNLDYNEFTQFLDEFALFYRLDVDAIDSFAHYGSASFPTFANLIFPERKNQ